MLKSAKHVKASSCDYRVIQEVYVGRKGSGTGYGFFVRIEASKVMWTGSAHSPEEAVKRSLSSLHCNHLKSLVGKGGIDSVVVRFRLEWRGVHGSDRIYADRPLYSPDWHVAIAEMGRLLTFGSPNAEALFRELEMGGERPQKRRSR